MSALQPAPPATSWYPPPAQPPPRPHPTRGNGRATAALIVGIAGIVLALPAGVPGLILGPIAYFLGKSALGPADGSPRAPGGHGTAVTGWVTGVIATGVGAVVTLLWLIVLFEAMSSVPSS